MNKWIPYGLIGFVIILLMILAFFIGRSRPDQQVIHDIVTQRQEQIKQEYDEKVNGLEQKVKTLTNDLEQSKARYRMLKGMIAQKAEEVKHVKPPETVADTKRAFTSLGYPPQ